MLRNFLGYEMGKMDFKGLVGTHVSYKKRVHGRLAAVHREH